MQLLTAPASFLKEIHQGEKSKEKVGKKVIESVPDSNGKDQSKQEKVSQETQEEYDPLKRDPAFANATMSCVWELVIFIFLFSAKQP